MVGTAYNLIRTSKQAEKVFAWCEANVGYNVVDIFNKLEKRLRGSLWKTIMIVRQKNIVKRGLW